MRTTCSGGMLRVPVVGLNIGTNGQLNVRVFAWWYGYDCVELFSGDHAEKEGGGGRDKRHNREIATLVGERNKELSVLMKTAFGAGLIE